MKEHTPAIFTILKKRALIVLALFYTVVSFSQCPYKLTLFPSDGPQTIDGVKVQVYRKGKAGANFSMCGGTGPYFPGYSQGVFGSGQFIFTFTPAVAIASLNINAISNYSGCVHEMSIYRNDAHYPVLSAGSAHTCEPLALLTPSGNIVGCNNCPNSGWNGTLINGPISKLVIYDSILEGRGASFFSLFFCKYNFTDVDELAVGGAITVAPHPFKENTVFTLAFAARSASLEVYNSIGQRVKVLNDIEGDHFTLSREGLPAGIYYYVLETDEKRTRTGKLVIEPR